MGNNCQPLNAFFDANTIINQLYPGYYALIPPPGANRIIRPSTPVEAFYGKGSVAFGGSPDLQFGYPSLPLVALQNLGLNTLTSSTDSDIFLPSGDLSLIVNQPFVVSLADATATYGPIKTDALADGGSGYVALDKYALLNGDNNPTSVVLSVATVSSGALVTYTLSTAPDSGIATYASPLFSPGNVALGTGGLRRANCTISDPGADYQIGDYISFSVSSCFALGQITAIDGGGGLTDFTLLHPGNDQTDATNLGVGTSGGGSGAKMDIVASVGTGAALRVQVLQGNGNLFLQFNYEIITVPYPCV